jgi:hypothetical protein
VRKSLLPLLLIAAACSSSQGVDLEEPRRLVGTENGVRVDAQIFGDRLSQSIRIPIKYDVTNERPQTIAIADLIPEVNYDPETATVTVNIGSEVPGAEFLPRLIAIPPGGKRSFDTVARVNILMGNVGTPLTRYPSALRMKINFLSETAPFSSLIGISERAVHDPKLADQLFPLWLERNETVYTNSLPMRWSREPEPAIAGPRRRRGGF